MGRRSTPQTFDDVLEKMRRESRSTKELGNKFENLMLDFFRTDRYYSNRFLKVYTWRTWPDNDGHPDTGIDLVAEERDGTLCAIQCKCHSDESTLALKAISNFPALATGKKFGRMVLVYTGGNITSNAERLLRSHRCQVIRSEDLRSSSFDWSAYPRLVAKAPNMLRDYQEIALNDVMNGFKSSDRGQLIMACGTGKTLVALHIAERLAGRGGTVLYLVPSISLIYQSMREWSNNANSHHYYVAVCSDKSVGKEREDSEEGTILELECPVSTDDKELRAHMLRRPKSAMTVVFSTYHSIKSASGAANGEFDLVLCDEAHRTAKLEKGTHYTYVHSNRNVPAKKRLYMTATPKIYGEVVKGAARARATQKKKYSYNNEDTLPIHSMDDEETYGKEFHRLGFVDAVHKYNALADFRVIIPMVSPEYMNSKLQKSVAKDGAIPLNERTLLAAVWHGLQYPDGENAPKKLLQKAIAFTNRIDRSEMFSGDRLDKNGNDRSFEGVVRDISKAKEQFEDKVDVKHIDGKKNALKRRKAMRWLGESVNDPGTCRILSNARCLSEGIDVPALDGVIFLQPRKSVVDVVQSVGRVMRTAKGKDTGYIVLPVAIPHGTDKNKELSKNKAYRTVWQVLNALRSHDESLVQEISSLTLDNTSHKNPGYITPRISCSILDVEAPDSLAILELFDKIKSTVVRTVGDIEYYDKYGQQIGEAAATVQIRIRNMIETSPTKRKDLDEFHADLQSTINNSVTRDGAIEVIAQHVVLSRVFDELFSGEFTTHNPISRVLSDMAASFGLDEELEELEEFYIRVKEEIKTINTPVARQNFIKKIYENFFKSTSKKETKKHGVVYTPVTVVDFVIHSVQDVLQRRFGMGFDDTRVKVLEPFVGTGTFITRLLGSKLLDGNMYQKYKNDLMANEMILLAYYIATVNIETTYSSLNGGRYVPFENISYTDTLLQDPRYNHGGKHAQEQVTLEGRFREANNRVKRQKSININVIMGNPPYSSGQRNYNDENPNVKYPDIDRRITDTYLLGVKAHAKNSLYDSYVRSLRWASDRIGASGVVAFVTNGSFMRSEVGAGIRASLAEEFDEIWCLDLRGNQRTHGETSDNEGGKIFGAGSRTQVAIVILVKASSGSDPKRLASIRYKDIGDGLTKEKKLEAVKEFVSINGVTGWKNIVPDRHNDWIGKRDDQFDNYLPMGAMGAKKGHGGALFRIYSRGIESSRDAWVYNSSAHHIEKNMRMCIEHCNSQDLDNIKIDSTKAKWTPKLKAKLKNNKPSFKYDNIRKSLYRPFFYQFLYFDETYINHLNSIPQMFPDKNSQNMIICVPHTFTGEFSIIITDVIPDLHVVDTNQCFPRYVYDGQSKIDNIPDSTLHDYQKYYNNKHLNKDDIFYYVYGMLHNSNYRKKFTANLTKALPRIPMASDFFKFSSVGKQLAKLHLNFNSCKRFNLGNPIQQFGKPYKISFNRKNKKLDKTKIKINGILVFENIPQSKYRVSGRTPLECVVDRYGKRPKDSGIKNNPLENMNDDDIIAIIERAVYVGIESDRLIADLPEEFEPKNWEPKKMGLDAHMAADARKRG